MVDQIARFATRVLSRIDDCPRRVLVAVLAIVAVGMTVLTYDPRVSRGGDNALYFALARSLADTGTYRNLVAPGEPFETSVPWGYPLLLSLGMRLGATYALLTLLSALSMLVAALAVFLLLEEDARGLAFLVGVLVCLNDYVIGYASKLLTEAPYMATSFAALALARRDRRFTIVGLATLAGVSYLLRPIGIALVVGLFAWLGTHRRWRDLVIATPIVLLVAGSWHVRCLLVPRSGENLYVRYFLQESKYQTSGITVGAVGLVDRVLTNVHSYALGCLPKIAFGEEGAWFLGGPLAVLIAVGYVATFARRRLEHFFLPLQLGALFLWLPESADIRYLVVLFPLLIWFALLGAGTVAERARPGTWALAALVLYGCSAGSSLDRLTWVLPRAHRIQERILAGDPIAGKPTSERSFIELCAWLRDHTERGDVIASRKARMVWYYANRSAVDLPPTAVPDDVVAFLDRHEVAYVVIDSLPTSNGKTRTRLEDTLRVRSDRFETVYVTADGDAVVRVVR